MTDISLHEGITTICDSAFLACYNLFGVQLPSTLTRIGDYGFYYCAFDEIGLPEGLETIGSYAFSLCGNLREITIPGSVKSIGKGAFRACKSLKEITLSASLIGENAFEGCEELDSITIMAVTPPEVLTDKELLPENKYATTILTVPENCKGTYQSHKVWGKFKNIEERDLTAIRDIPAQMVNGKSSDGKCFDLSGRRLAVPPAKGIYIKDGKKVVKPLP